MEKNSNLENMLLLQSKLLKEQFKNVACLVNAVNKLTPLNQNNFSGRSNFSGSGRTCWTCRKLGHISRNRWKKLWNNQYQNTSVQKKQWSQFSGNERRPVQ